MSLCFEGYTYMHLFMGEKKILSKEIQRMRENRDKF